jgi:hypothetical protein
VSEVPLCVYHLRGTCRFATACKFRHDDGIKTDDAWDAEPSQLSTKLVPCKYYSKGGHCNYGDYCMYSHEFITGVSLDASGGGDDKVSADPIPLCGICMEPVIEKFGLLSGCDHVFCVPCIQTWRNGAASTLSSSEKNAKRQCPMCRTHSHYIITSHAYLKGEGRERFIADTLEKRKRTPCQQFQKNKKCSFGTRCMYFHLEVEEASDGKNKGNEEKEKRAQQAKRISHILCNIGHTYCGRVLTNDHVDEVKSLLCALLELMECADKRRKMYPNLREEVWLDKDKLDTYLLHSFDYIHSNLAVSSDDGSDSDEWESSSLSP